MKAETTKLLEKVFDPIGRCLTNDSAREILGLRADTRSRRRLQMLAKKCDAGELTPEERAEYQVFVEVGDLVALLQAKARRFLNRKHHD